MSLVSFVNVTIFVASHAWLVMVIPVGKKKELQIASSRISDCTLQKKSFRMGAFYVFIIF